MMLVLPFFLLQALFSNLAHSWSTLKLMIIYIYLQLDVVRSTLRKVLLKEHWFLPSLVKLMELDLTSRFAGK